MKPDDQQYNVFLAHNFICYDNQIHPIITSNLQFVVLKLLKCSLSIDVTKLITYNNYT